MQIRFFATAFAAVFWIANASAAPATLQPHLGVYELSLSSTRAGAGIVAAAGRLVIEVTDSCDGYAQTQRMLLRLQDSRGQEMVSDSNYTTWESRDGNVIRFNARSALNGEVSEKYSGRAELEGRGEGGVVTFSDPDMPKVDLQEGTIFPTQHFFEIIETALAGETVLNRRLYDGSGPDGIYDTVAIVSRGGGTNEEVGGELLDDLSSWRIRLAYFMPDDQGGIPEYEIGLRLYQNGVTSDLLLDYGDFSMTAKLSRLEFLSADC